MKNEIEEIEIARLKEQGFRLKTLRGDLDLTLMDVARAVGVKSKTAVQNWETGKNNVLSKYMGALCELLKTTEKYLRHGELEPGEPSPGTNYIFEVHPSKLDEFFSGGCRDVRHEIPKKLPSTCFGVVMLGGSMKGDSDFPQIEEGTVVIIDTALTPENGDVVLAKDLLSKSYIIRNLVVELDEHILAPSNRVLKDIEVNENIKIVGVAAGDMKINLKRLKR